MIQQSKVIRHGKLACRWRNDFMTAPDMSMKWVAACQWHAFSNDRAGRRERGPTECEYWGGLWEREARNNP